VYEKGLRLLNREFDLLHMVRIQRRDKCLKASVDIDAKSADESSTSDYEMDDELEANLHV
jgi:hypothetical protein